MKALLLVSGAVLLLAMLVVVVAGEDEAWDTGSGAGESGAATVRPVCSLLALATVLHIFNGC